MYAFNLFDIDSIQVRTERLVDEKSLETPRHSKTTPIPKIISKKQDHVTIPYIKAPPSSKSFLIKPSTILFEHCIPGKSYKQTLQVQNSTAHIMSYLVDPFHASVSSFLTVQPTASAAIPPGLKWDIVINFFTAWDMKEDIETGLTLRSSTGVTHIIPVFAKLKHEASFIEYSGKKFAFDTSPTLSMNFGICQIKKTKKLTFSISNDGLFDGSFILDGTVSEGFVLDKTQVRLKAGEVSVFSLTYSPQTAHALKNTQFKILHSESGHQITIDCVATLPTKALRLSKSLVEFGMCLPNKVYHAEIELFNLQQAALTYDAEFLFDKLSKTNLSPITITHEGQEIVEDIKPKSPKRQLKNSVYVRALQGEFEIFPKKGLIQRNSSSKIKIKFIKHLTRSTDSFDFVLPVSFRNDSTGEQWITELKGTICSFEYVLKRGDVAVPRYNTIHMHLQPHPVFENKIEKFTLYNPSIIAQDFKISVDGSNAKLSDSVIRLEKFETMTFKLTMSNLKPEENRVVINVKSTFLNHSFPFSILGVSPAVYFTNSFLSFAPITLLSSKEITTKICFNTHTDPEEDFEYEYTFDAPKIISSKIEEVTDRENKWSYLDVSKCPLKVYPNQALLQTSDMITLKILANPTFTQVGPAKDVKLSSSQMDINDAQAIEAKKNKLKETKPPAKVEVKGGKKEIIEPVIVPIVESKIDKQMQLLHSKLDSFKNTELNCVIVCHVKRYPSEKLLLKRLLDVITTADSKMEEVEESIQLHVTVPIIRPDYYFLEDKDSSKRAPFKIDFGRVIFGEVTTKSIPFKVISLCMLEAITTSQHETSIFSFPNLNTLDLLSENLIVECHPKCVEAREESYIFKSEFTSTFISFTAESFTPKICVSSNMLTYPDTLVGEQSSQMVSLSNPGEYPIIVKLKIVNSDAHTFAIASEIVIQPLINQDVIILFKPQSFMLGTNSGLSIKYTGQQDDHFVNFTCRGCETTVSVTGFDNTKQIARLKSSSIEFNIIDNYMNFEREEVDGKEVGTDVKSSLNDNRTQQGSLTNINTIEKSKSYRYAMYTYPGSDFCITNLKPIAKIENIPKKLTTNLNYTIELFDGTFYIDSFGHHVITERVAKVFHTIELTSGVLEIGQSKKFSVKKNESVIADLDEERASFYKITLTGGFRVVEPKRVVAAEEPSIYILKVVDCE